VAAFKKDDHRHADTLDWHGSRQDNLHLVALGTAGRVIVRKKFNRKQFLAYTANFPASLTGLEACSGAYFLGRGLRQRGHDVRLIPAQFVKPFVKSKKDDFIGRPSI